MWSIQCMKCVNNKVVVLSDVLVKLNYKTTLKHSVTVHPTRYYVKPISLARYQLAFNKVSAYPYPAEVKLNLATLNLVTNDLYKH